jgi:hypothetical protein
MKRIACSLAAIVGIAAGAALLGSCQMSEPAAVAVSIKAGATGPSSKALVGGETVSAVTAYRVVFRKVEIGNSESEKYTLWEDEAGKPENIVSSVSLADVRSIPPGTYKFVRLTVGDTLSVDGQVSDGGVIYKGTGTCILGSTTHLWGTEVATADGASTLSSPITIAAGSTISFAFAIDGTITYQGGSADNAVLSVTKPVLSLTAN